MSTGESMPLATACAYAAKVKQILAPHCQRIEVAGSIRRNKPQVHDIEIVCIPKAEFNLLNEAFRTDSRIQDVLFGEGYAVKMNGPHFKQFSMGPISCDLFLTTPEQWGVIFTLRTGCADFSHRLVTPRNAGGLMPSNLRVKDGLIWHGDTAYDTPEEEDVFRVMGMNWIDPERRAQ